MVRKNRRLNLKKIIEPLILIALMFPIFFLKYIGTLSISEEAKTIIVIGTCFFGVAILLFDLFRVISKNEYTNSWFIVMANAICIIALVLYSWFSYKSFGESNLEVLDKNSQYVLATQTLFFIALVGREILRGHICKRKIEIEKPKAKKRKSK